ncbi:MAG TPA: hypothetical protein VLC28_12860, partial [Flavitalea sp.]|nr:hypothetical protein [Flavitalea sp.]
MFTRYALIFLLLTSCRDGTQLPATSEPVEDSPGYKWKKLSDNGGFVPTDRIQFLNVRDTLWSFNANGNYYSTDGIHFLLSGLQPKVSSIGIPGYLYINNRLIAAIPTRGRSLIDSNTIEIFKSDDLLHWNFQRTATSLGLSTTSALIGFKGKIWIFGAKDSAGITSS